MERVLFFSISFSGVMTGRADLHGHISRNVQAIIETPCVSLSLSVCVCVCLCVCVQLCHMEHHDGNIYIKYAVGHKTSKFVFLEYFLSSLQAVMKINDCLLCF